MTKAQLTLYIDTNIKESAKASGLNLSAEFEEWLRIRLGNINEDRPKIDVDLEIAKHQAEIQKLKSQAELIKEEEFKIKEQEMVLDNIIDNMKKERITKTQKYPVILEWKDFINNKNYGIESRIHGIQFLFKQRFNKIINPLEAKELLEKRLKEKGLI